MKKHWKKWHLSLAALSTIFASSTVLVPLEAAPASGSNSVWIESEKPESLSPQEFKLDTNNVGPVELLSGNAWLKVAVESDQVEKQVPESGVLLTYKFDAPSVGDYALWNRIGYEKVRSAFRWRLDSGAWSAVSPTEDTLNVTELSQWNPVAWLPMGRANLSVGSHTLEIRVPRAKDDKGAAAKTLYASDAICLTQGDFHPDGKIRPGDTGWMSDNDKAAAQHVFDVPVPADAAQTKVSLKGTWQYAADDEMVVDDRLGPIKAAPTANELSWCAINIPSDRNKVMPEQAYVHRYYLRTRVNVPSALNGRSFYLRFPMINMIATVFVNGQRVGWTKNPLANWELDVTKSLKPGQVNEIWVGMKDTFYALTQDDMKRHLQYLPYDFWRYSATNTLDMPVLWQYAQGIIDTPSLVVAGSAYTSDVFAIPSVQKKALQLEVTLNNPTDASQKVEVHTQVVPLQGGAAEKTFTPRTVSIPAGQTTLVKLNEAWQNPKLWWPDDPQQYYVVTSLKIGDKTVDVRRTKFGFREWTWDGPNFKLNGIPWHGRADTNTSDILTAKKNGQTMSRVWWEREGMEQFLDDYDRYGLPIRRSSIFDGEGTAGFYDVKRPELWNNFREQLAAFIKGERNHPSIFIWSLENEITYINGHVMGNDDVTTREIKKVAEVAAQVDPTRPQMIDGGNALLDESLPVYGGHYLEPDITTFPEGAYDRAAFAHRQVWPITKQKPILLGEAGYGGSDPPVQATIGGEQAFIGKAEAKTSIDMAHRMLTEAYRWNDVNFQFWSGEQLGNYYSVWKPIVALVRQWDWSFGSGQKVPRTVGIFNDTRSATPISLSWTFTVGGKLVSQSKTTHQVAAGGNEKFNIVLSMPAVTTRQEGTWKLVLSREGKTVFEDTKKISVLPPAAPLFQITTKTSAKATPAKVVKTVTVPPKNALPTTTSQRVGLGVFDPSGEVRQYLQNSKIAFTDVASLSTIPSGVKVLVVGRNALDAATATSSRLAAWASTGRSVIVLEQQNPLKYQGLPGQMEVDTNQGAIAFAEDLTHPVLAGLQQKDFFTWGSDGWVYRNAYVKPTSGGKSLIQAHLKLANSALVEMQAGSGVLLLNQLLVGEKLNNNPVAQRLLANLIRYAASYKLVYRPTVLTAAKDTPLKKAVDAMGLRYARANDAISALAKPGSVAVIEATPANLQALAANPVKVREFTAGGGWIVLNNLTPAGLASYNKLVGVNHIIRPFHAEKVTWPAQRHPLTAGLPASNIVMGTGQQIFWFTGGEWPDPEAYSYVVDLDEVAPFATSTFPNWDKITNNFTQNDGFWPLVINFEAPTDGKPYEIPIKLARPEKVTEFTWSGNQNYDITTKIGLVINGDTANRYVWDVAPTTDPQSFPIKYDKPVTSLTVQIIGWQQKPNVRDLLGADNVWIKVARPASYTQKVKPLLNIGAVVAYPQEKGGILLCNVNFKASEANPANVVKKQTVLATLLRNLQATFSGGKSLIAGGNLAYSPVSIAKQANQYRGEQGWFGEPQFNFSGLPTGKQTFASVNYDIYKFTTSIVPEAIMLGGAGIPGNLGDAVRGIPVGRKVDALFFLQTARIDQPRNEGEIRDKKEYELARYVVHYADGETAIIPLRQDYELASYKQSGTPVALPNAQLAFTKKWAGTDQTAVAYSMQWNNPHPDVAITSIDLEAGKDKSRGVPALLAVTAATATK